MDTEHRRKLHARPIVYGISRKIGDYLAIFLKLFKGIGISRNKILVHTANTHQTMLVGIGCQPQGNDVVIRFVRLDIGNTNMVVKINDRQILDTLQIKLLRVFTF